MTFDELMIKYQVDPRKVDEEVARQEQRTRDYRRHQVQKLFRKAADSLHWENSEVTYSLSPSAAA